MQFEKALEAYDFTLALRETFYHAIFNKANSLANLERYKEAISAYREYLKYDAENDDAWCYMGECYLNQGRYRMAGRYYRKALEINPENDIALFSKGIIFWLEKNYEKSLSLIKKAISLEKETLNTGLPMPGCLRIQDTGKKRRALLKRLPYSTLKIRKCGLISPSSSIPVVR